MSIYHAHDIHITIIVEMLLKSPPLNSKYYDGIKIR